VLVGIVQYFFYFVPLHCFAAYEWLCRLAWGRAGPMGNAADWTSLMLGGYLQGVCIQTFMATVGYGGPGELSLLPERAHACTVGALTVTAAAVQMAAFLTWDAATALSK